jgi:hypothetical protein
VVLGTARPKQNAASTATLPAGLPVLFTQLTLRVRVPLVPQLALQGPNAPTA